MRKISLFLAVFMTVLSGMTVVTLAQETVTSASPAPTDKPLFTFTATAENLPNVWNSPNFRAPAGADGYIRVENEHFVNDAGIMRFWGINICMSANFPEKDVASAMARRIASFGLNLARLHHLDLREIWGKNYPHQTEMDTEKLDKLDWLIYELKRNGVYVNINLHVSRKFTEEDGFPNYDIRPQHDKGLDNFMPRMIELQKKYARELLTHVNPYTKMSYLEDPCVAMVEINNENSIVSQWLGGGLDKHLAPFCEVELQKLWNEWLREKYGTTAKVHRAWGTVELPYEENQIQDGSFDGDVVIRSAHGKPGWNLEMGADGKATLEIQDGKLIFDVIKNGKDSWHPQIYFTRLKTEKGKPYTIKFRARSNPPQKVALSCVQMNSPWGLVAQQKALEVSSDWQDFEYTFLAQVDEEQARVGICFVQEGTKLEFDDFTFCKGGRVGIGADEKIEDGTVRVAKRFHDFQRCSAEMRSDFTQFTLDLEAKYFQYMYDFVKKELGCQRPVAGTQLTYGSAYPQARMDYVDIHDYWNHPNFPSGAWSGTDWYVRNTALVNVMGSGGTLAGTAAMRVLGKPYTVSEYNHPYPNFYFAEGYPSIAAIAGFQDWSAIMLFDWAHSPQNNHTVGFFDIHGNAPALVHQPACYNLFVRGDAQSGLKNALENGKSNIVNMSISEEHAALRECGGLSAYFNKDKLLPALRCRTFTDYSGVRLTDLPNTESSARTGRLMAMSNVEQEKDCETLLKKSVSSTGELIWNAETEKKGYFLIDTSNTKVFTGFVNGRTFTFADGTKLLPGATILDWATISMTRTDLVGDASGKVTDATPNCENWLLAATGFVRNQNMKLRIRAKNENDLKASDVTDLPSSALPTLLDEPLTTCKATGNGPAFCEGIDATIQLPAPKNAEVKYYPLTGSGDRKTELTARRISDTVVEIVLSQKHETLWYEIEIVKP
ncbi:MAG: carbohydrate binding domain-containing protein [Planctomycetia bacterium]|nr:carbohydrate binding domain-containing protein [Planctomycetia bacterium]